MRLSLSPSSARRRISRFARLFPVGLGAVLALATFLRGGQCLAQSAGSYLPDGVNVLVDSAHDTDAEATRLSAIGAVYSVVSPTSSRLIYSFGATGDGKQPECRLEFNSGVTQLWGTTQNGGANGYGEAYYITISTGAETKLFGFPGPTSGGEGYSGLLYSFTDSYYYGTLRGEGLFGGGSIFKVSASAIDYPFQFGY